MKVLQLSDLHLDFWRIYSPNSPFFGESGAYESRLDLSKKIGFTHNYHQGFDLSLSDCDLIILNGDIDNGISGALWAIVESEFLQKPIIYVAGNHDYYGMHFEEMNDSLRTFSKKYDFFHYLEKDELVLNNVRFLGTTLWTDFKVMEDKGLSREHALYEAKSRLNDFRAIYTDDGILSPLDTVSINEDSIGWIDEKLSDGKDYKNVVITHHGPTKECQGDFPWNNISPCFVSDFSDVVTKSDIWFSGHTHQNIDVIKGNARLVSNQCGYPGEATNKTFDINKIIKV